MKETRKAIHAVLIRYLDPKDTYYIDLLDSLVTVVQEQTYKTQKSEAENEHFNSYKPWTSRHKLTLFKMVNEDCSLDEICIELGRSIGSISAKLNLENAHLIPSHLPLKPYVPASTPLRIPQQKENVVHENLSELSERRIRLAGMLSSIKEVESVEVHENKFSELRDSLKQ